MCISCCVRLCDRFNLVDKDLMYSVVDHGLFCLIPVWKFGPGPSALSSPMKMWNDYSPLIGRNCSGRGRQHIALQLNRQLVQLRLASSAICVRLHRSVVHKRFSFAIPRASRNRQYADFASYLHVFLSVSSIGLGHVSSRPMPAAKHASLSIVF